MNKILLIPLTLLPVIVGVNPLVSEANKKEQNIKSEKENSIDWEKVNNLLPHYINHDFSNFQKYYSNFDQSQLVQSIKYAKKYSEQKIKEFQVKNYSLEQIFDVLNNHKITQNKFTFSFDTWQLNQANLKVVSDSQTYDNYNKQNLNWLKGHVNNLRFYKTTFITISATSAIAAAGFWAAAWFFGLTVGLATGCTTISAITAGVSAGISMALVSYDKEMNKWIRAGTTLGSAITLGHIFYRILYATLISASSAATAWSWAFPAVLAILPITGSILSWVSLYK